MTLALLLTAVTGAWAVDDLIMKELTVPSEWKTDENPLTADEMTGFKDFSSLTDDEAKALLNSVPTDKVIIFYGTGASSNSFKLVQKNWDQVAVGELPLPHSTLFDLKDDYKFYYTTSDAIEVTPGSSANTWTFSMPGSDVVLTPIYAKAAAFATTGTEPEVKALLPAAAEGVIAGTDASLIAEGTGIVAFAGTSTDVKQGTLMYAIGTSATEAPALTAFSATVPTAKDIADDGATLYVWYYIQGADAPDGVAATLDNTFDNTEPACLTVQVLTNKFDIQFNAANANTIEAGKATVTVGGTDKTGDITEGKLQGVKLGSEVKVKANTGYKFRKVEVKKAEAGPLAAAFKDGAKFKVGYKWNSVNTTYLEFTNSGGTYSLTSVSGLNEANGFNSSTLTVKDGNVLALDVVCHPEGTSKMDRFCAQIEFDATSSTYKYSSKGSGFTGIISVSVNDADITSQLTEAN